VTLTAAQSGLPAHSHGLYQPSGSGPLPAVSWTLAASTAAGYAATCDQGGWNASQAHENMPPYYALVYIIKAF
jgi:microcystin-dependent protein